MTSKNLNCDPFMEKCAKVLPKKKEVSMVMIIGVSVMGILLSIIIIGTISYFVYKLEAHQTDSLRTNVSFQQTQPKIQQELLNTQMEQKTDLQKLLTEETEDELLSQLRNPFTSDTRKQIIKIILNEKQKNLSNDQLESLSENELENMLEDPSIVDPEYKNRIKITLNDKSDQKEEIQKETPQGPSPKEEKKQTKEETKMGMGDIEKDYEAIPQNMLLDMTDSELKTSLNEFKSSKKTNQSILREMERRKKIKEKQQKQNK